MYRQYQEVLYKGQKAIVWLVLGCIDASDYVLRLYDGRFVPVLETELSEVQLQGVPHA
jgi:hypothetical protein